MKHTTLSLFALLAIGANAQIADESFENTGAGGGEWTESSTNFGTPLCNPALCGGTGARTGIWWAWFGGAGPGVTGGTQVPEIGSLDQDAAIPTGSTVELIFHLAIIGSNGTASDFIELNVDGVQQWEATIADSAVFGGAYAEVAVPMGAFVAGTHNIEFYGEQMDSTSVSNFFIDDVEIHVNGTPVLGLFENENLPGFQVFPSPADAMLTMNFNALEGSGTVTITDVNGKVVNSQVLTQVFQRTFNFDTRELPNGIYTVTLENAGKTYSRRVVVAH